MTTPTAADIEAIRARWADPNPEPYYLEEMQAALRDACEDIPALLAALDAATAERDAAQARIRELEGRRCDGCGWAREDCSPDGDTGWKCIHRPFQLELWGPGRVRIWVDPDHSCAAWKPREGERE